jgi:hypothetical protein
VKGGLVVEFAGPVQCRQEPEPAALLLTGAERAGAAPLELRFLAPEPHALPGIVSDIDVYALGDGEWRLRAHGGSWTVRARTLLVHRDVGRRFYRALPPPRVPWRTRCGWSALLAAVRLPGAERLLRFLRSR